MSPRNSYVEALNLSTSENSCVWIQGPSRGDLVKMQSRELGVIQYDWCPSKKTRLGHRWYPDWGMTMWRHSRNAASKEMGLRCSNPLAPWLWVSSLQNYEKINFCCLCHPALWCFAVAALESFYEMKKVLFLKSSNCFPSSWEFLQVSTRSTVRSPDPR